MAMTCGERSEVSILPMRRSLSKYLEEGLVTHSQGNRHADMDSQLKGVRIEQCVNLRTVIEL